MEYRGVEYRVLQTIPRGWTWQFERDGIRKRGNGTDRAHAIHRAKMAIDAVLRASPEADRILWQIGQRVCRKDNPELGTVVDCDGKLKVRWDGGGTSYFSHAGIANAELKSE